MPINPASRSLKEKLLENFEKRGCVVRKIHRHGEIYSINSKRVNIRCRTKHKTVNDSRLFWYSFDFNLANDVDFVIFITTNEDFFVIMKPSVLVAIKDKLYPFKRNESARTFYIDWDELNLLHRDGRIDIGKHHGSFSSEDLNLPQELILTKNQK